jgi:hypothetical protein
LAKIGARLLMQRFFRNFGDYNVNSSPGNAKKVWVFQNNKNEKLTRYTSCRIRKPEAFVHMISNRTTGKDFRVSLFNGFS